MSSRHLFLQSSNLVGGATHLQSGVGRHVTQLARLVIKFCKSHGGSKGVREFIENDIIDFAKLNPGVAMYLKPRRHRSPVLVTEFLNGNREWMSLHNMSREEVYQWTGSMIGSLQRSNVKIKKNWHTDYPSVQGPWCAVGNPPQPKEQEPLSPAVQKLLLLAKENNTKSQ